MVYDANVCRSCLCAFQIYARQDAQERLIYCALLVLRDDIERFQPSPTDLDYPNRLISHAGTEKTPAASDGSAEGSDGSYGSAAPVSLGKDETTHRSLYATW